MVYFRRFVAIKNPKLDALACFSWLVYVAVFLFVCWYGDMYLESRDISKDMHFQMYSNSAETLPFADLRASWSAQLLNPVCLVPSRYDFWFDEAGLTAYDGFQCIDICPDAVLQIGCLNRHQIIQEPLPDRLTIATYIKDVVFNTTVSPTRKWVIPWDPKVVSVDIEYGISTENHGILAILGLRKKHLTHHSSFKDIATVLRNPENHIMRVFAPGDKIQITVQDMLDYSVETDGFSLDDPNKGASVNRKPSAYYSNGPIPRLLGADMQVQVACHNFALGDEPELPHAKLYCSMRFNYNGRNLAPYNVMEPIDSVGRVAMRSYHGVRIHLVPYGFFMHASAFQISFCLMIFLIFAVIPGALLNCFVTGFLGQYSKVYYQAQYRRCNLFEDSKGLLARLVVSHLSFDQFQDKANHLLEKEVLAARVTNSILHHHVMKDREAEGDTKKQRLSAMLATQSQDTKLNMLKALSDLAYHALFATDQKFSCAQKIRSILKPTSQLNWDIDAHGVSLDQFMDAAAEDETIMFKELAQLFDSERIPGRLERWFENSKVKMFRDHAEKRIEEENPKIIAYFRYCFADQNYENKDIKSVVSPEEVWKGKTNTRLDKFLGRLAELDLTVKEMRDAKPPIVITLPTTPSMENKRTIDVILDSSEGDEVGIGFLMEPVIDENGVHVAEISEIHETGLLSRWNEENQESQIVAGDRISLLNDSVREFSEVQRQLALDGVHHLVITKCEESSRRRLDTELSPRLDRKSGPDESGAAPVKTLVEKEDEVRDLEDQIQLKLEDKHAIEKKFHDLEFSALNKEVAELEKTLDRLGTLLDFSAEEYSIFKSRILFDASCYKCGKHFSSDSTRLCACDFSKEQSPLLQTLEIKSDATNLTIKFRRPDTVLHGLLPLQASALDDDTVLSDEQASNLKWKFADLVVSTSFRSSFFGGDAVEPWSEPLSPTKLADKIMKAITGHPENDTRRVLVATEDGSSEKEFSTPHEAMHWLRTDGLLQPRQPTIEAEVPVAEPITDVVETKIEPPKQPKPVSKFEQHASQYFRRLAENLATHSGGGLLVDHGLKKA